MRGTVALGDGQAVWTDEALAGLVGSTFANGRVIGASLSEDRRTCMAEVEFEAPAFEVQVDDDRRGQWEREFVGGWCPSRCEVERDHRIHYVQCTLGDHHEGECLPSPRWRFGHDCERSGCP
jgi:hypothetical protein